MESENKPLSISDRVFVYGILCTMLIAILAGGALLIFATSAISEARVAQQQATQYQTQYLTLKEQLYQCQLISAKLDGRVGSFESMLIHPQRTAVRASIKDFMQINEGRGPLTVNQFEAWLEGRK